MKALLYPDINNLVYLSVEDNHEMLFESQLVNNLVYLSIEDNHEIALREPLPSFLLRIFPNIDRLMGIGRP